MSRCTIVGSTVRLLVRALVSAAVTAATLEYFSGAVGWAAPVGERPLAVRVQWGGGQPQAWSGTIAVVATGDSATGRSDAALSWRTLSTEPDAAAMAHESGGVILVHQPRPVASDGIEIEVPNVRDRKLVVSLTSVASGRGMVTIDVPLADVVAAAVQQPLDDGGNRLTVRPAPGESLRVTLAPAGGDPAAAAGATVWRPGDRIRCTVTPLLPAKADAVGVELRMRLRAVEPGLELATQTVPLVPLGGVATEPAEGPAATGDRRPLRFEPVVFDVQLPGDDGVYEIDLEAVERGGIRWTRPLALRTVQVVAVAEAAPQAAVTGEWKVAYELDPGSPRLHERLRRLPGVGLPQVGLPAVPLPAMSLPAIARPNVTLPKLPGVSIPNVSSISNMVPRLSGLLATGHSRVEPHPLGPMLRLPPADAAGVPSWEGIVVAGAQPGQPHVVEIEFPSDQDAVVATTVLELDAAGAAVRPRHTSGFEVRREVLGGPSASPPRLDMHRFIFWPTTRQPVVVISNPAPRTTAVFGRVRVLCGHGRLPAVAAREGGKSRRVYAFLPAPDLAAFGGVERAERQGGRCLADWRTHLGGIGNSADFLKSQAVAGAMIPVYASGAALWPSRCTRQAPRWGAGSTGDAGLDPDPRDVLEVLCRMYGREGLRLVPAVSFHAPLPAVEEILAAGGNAAVGIACVGRDGRPRRSASGGVHYNILDPRVQRAVEELVLELAGRVRGRVAVDSIAVLLPHDGWMHLPGVAWGLDDATFARFRTAVPQAGPEPEEGRFAARAALVEGPLRESWLRWRAEQITRFHARLAERIAGCDERLSLAIVPTTLFTSGEIAGRFRPILGDSPSDAELLREIGLDPLGCGEHPRLVFVSPSVCGGSGLVDRSSLVGATRSPAVARAAAGSGRRAAVILVQERSLDLSAVAAHGPFGAAAPPAACPLHVVPTGIDGQRALAEPFIAADAEAVFDMRLASAAPASLPPARRAIESLPAGRMEVVAGLPPPLVVRTRRAAAKTWVHVVNAAPVPGQVALTFRGRPTTVMEHGSATLLSPAASGDFEVVLEGWGMQCLSVDGDADVVAARIAYPDGVREAVAQRIERLGRRRAALESPVPLDVLDNPGFEIGGVQADGSGPAIPGWELLEPRRGMLALVPGDGVPAGRAAAFSSATGLATLRSNPFGRPASGRLSIAAWLRIRDGDPQPPLRIALEGVQGNREYYRFAAVGGLTGGPPLTTAWSQFVLQIDDLPEEGLESLRVRFDLLGPGTVEIDGVRLFDLAFDESQRVQLSRMVAGLEERLAAGDIGGCLVKLDGHWPRYLEAFVAEAQAAGGDAAGAASTGGVAGASGPAAQPEERAGVLERMRRWWQ